MSEEQQDASQNIIQNDRDGTKPNQSWVFPPNLRAWKEEARSTASSREYQGISRPWAAGFDKFLQRDP